ncbi:hypothetical protein Forpe1208_v013507 [Fusarium oxysporum f. sp. rapae]|uniref:Uncharacterized protein n=1 Tax=Fusarium oxysporum f. sp. rapae TaxID=485398 RepID=A0A8J5NKU2_FUSOX|nr:hypothetical protein Forpe1208_v013507 [Fusarium oxysporum f. sp. rapae]
MFNEDLRNVISTKSCLFPDGVGIDLPIGTMVKEKPDCVIATTFYCIFQRRLNAFRIDPFLPPSGSKETHNANFFPERLKPRYNTETRRHLKSLRRMQHPMKILVVEQLAHGPKFCWQRIASYDIWLLMFSYFVFEAHS